MRKVRLGDICDVLNGYAFKSSNYVLDGIRIIRITNVQKGYIADDDPKYYPIEAQDTLKKYMLNQDDLLISLTGNVGRVGLLPKLLLPAALNQRVACLRLKNSGVEIDRKYLFHALNSDIFENACIYSSNGIAQKNLSTEWLKDYYIPLYSVEKQKIIVEKLDLIIRLINLRTLQLQKLDELVKSRFIEMFGDPVFNNMHWDVFALEDLVQDDCTISYGIVQTGEDLIDGVPVLRPIDIVGGTVPQLDRLKHTSKVISDQYKRTLLKGRELLITVRANIGDTCIVGNEFKGCNVGRGIVPIRVDETKIKLEFLQAQLNELHMHDFIKSKAKGITLIQLNMVDLRKIELIVPPIHIQLQYIDFEKVIKKSKIVIQKSLDELETLKKSLMQQYFG